MGDGVSGACRGEVSLDAAFPEPYIGALDHRPVGVFLGLNPGQAQLDFQGRSGLFADEIRYRGTYSAWAATWPYLRDPWVARMGANRHLRSRLGFLRIWTEQPLLTADAMVAFELYPWHSTAVTASGLVAGATDRGPQPSGAGIPRRGWAHRGG